MLLRPNHTSRSSSRAASVSARCSQRHRTSNEELQPTLIQELNSYMRRRDPQTFDHEEPNCNLNSDQEPNTSSEEHHQSSYRRRNPQPYDHGEPSCSLNCAQKPNTLSKEHHRSSFMRRNPQTYDHGESRCSLNCAQEPRTLSEEHHLSYNPRTYDNGEPSFNLNFTQEPNTLSEEHHHSRHKRRNPRTYDHGETRCSLNCAQELNTLSDEDHLSYNPRTSDHVEPSCNLNCAHEPNTLSEKPHITYTREPDSIMSKIPGVHHLGRSDSHRKQILDPRTLHAYHNSSSRGSSRNSTLPSNVLSRAHGSQFSTLQDADQDYFLKMQRSRISVNDKRRREKQKQRINAQSVMLIGCFALMFVVAIIMFVAVCYQNGWLGLGRDKSQVDNISRRHNEERHRIHKPITNFPDVIQNQRTTAPRGAHHVYKRVGLSERRPHSSIYEDRIYQELPQFAGLVDDQTVGDHQDTRHTSSNILNNPINELPNHADSHQISIINNRFFHDSHPRENVQMLQRSFRNEGAMTHNDPWELGFSDKQSEFDGMGLVFSSEDHFVQERSTNKYIPENVDVNPTGNTQEKITNNMFGQRRDEGTILLHPSSESLIHEFEIISQGNTTNLSNPGVTQRQLFIGNNTELMHSPGGQMQERDTPIVIVSDSSDDEMLDAQVMIIERKSAPKDSMSNIQSKPQLERSDTHITEEKEGMENNENFTPIIIINSQDEENMLATLLNMGQNKKSHTNQDVRTENRFADTETDSRQGNVFLDRSMVGSFDPGNIENRNIPFDHRLISQGNLNRAIMSMNTNSPVNFEDPFMKQLQERQVLEDLFMKRLQESRMIDDSLTRNMQGIPLPSMSSNDMTSRFLFGLFNQDSIMDNGNSPYDQMSMLLGNPNRAPIMNIPVNSQRMLEDSLMKMLQGSNGNNDPIMRRLQLMKMLQDSNDNNDSLMRRLQLMKRLQDSNDNNDSLMRRLQLSGVLNPSILNRMQETLTQSPELTKMKSENRFLFSDFQDQPDPGITINMYGMSNNEKDLAERKIKSTASASDQIEFDKRITSIADIPLEDHTDEFSDNQGRTLFGLLTTPPPVANRTLSSGYNFTFLRMRRPQKDKKDKKKEKDKKNKFSNPFSFLFDANEQGINADFQSGGGSNNQNPFSAIFNLDDQGINADVQSGSTANNQDAGTGGAGSAFDNMPGVGGLLRNLGIDIDTFFNEEASVSASSIGNQRADSNETPRLPPLPPPPPPPPPRRPFAIRRRRPNRQGVVSQLMNRLRASVPQPIANMFG